MAPRRYRPEAAQTSSDLERGDQIADHSVLGRIGRFSVRFPVPILCFWFIAAFLSVYFLPSLSSVTQNLQNAVLPSSAASVQAAGLDAPFQNPEVITGTIVAVTKVGPLTSADLTDFTTLESRVLRLHGIAGVVDEGVSADKQARHCGGTERPGSPGKGKHTNRTCKRDSQSLRTCPSHLRPAGPSVGINC